MISVDKRTLASLRALASQLRIKDIGISPERREIYLLGGPRSLTSLLGNMVFMAWHQRGQHSVERSWNRLEIVLIDLLEEANVPQPGPIGSNGPWREGLLPGDDFASSWDVIPIPAPGGPQFPWWSAKTGRLMDPVEVSPRRFCDDGPAEGFGGSPTGNKPALLQLVSSELPPIFVSHGVGLHDMKAIEDCRGLLWPSFAVTWKVPPAYGDVVFLADVHLLIESLSPTRRTGPWRDLFLSPTDSWSPTARELADVEAAATHELRGDIEWWHGNYGVPGYGGKPGGRGNRFIQDRLIASAGRTDDLVGTFAPDSASARISSMDRLWSRVRALVKVHTRASGLYDYEDLDSLSERLGLPEDSADRYAYLELKVRGMAPISDMVACFYPRRHARRVNAFLDRMGFVGWRVPFRYMGPVADASSHDDAERVRWASAATQAILEWAENPCARATARPDGVDGVSYADKYPYRAVAQYSLHPDYGLDAQYKHHFRWSRGYCPEESNMLESSGGDS